MNIIVLTKSQTQARQIDLMSPRFIAMGVAILIAAFSLLFFAGFQIGTSGVDPDKHARLLALQESLNAQSLSIEEQNERLNNNIQEKVNAVAIRLGQLQARLIRLDAMGGRLTEMAGLEKSEFDFTEVPPQGGPESAPHSVSLTELGSELDLFDNYLEDREQQLKILDTFLEVHQLSQDTEVQGKPAPKGWISSHYGKRIDPFTGKKANHTGVDFAGYDGADVVSVAAGVVTWTGPRSGYGEMIEINHGNGYATRYAHNKVNLVGVGDQVQKGDVIALMGQTGRATGPNLHFEVLKNGQSVNPVPFIKKSR
ncbi:MAG: peptidoglycan DD-metalloendopeptidase family protein [Gammaproteobacteria bacterium]|nr:peptidoglycan DD-metalloendopeptidase family protein [Gammaproteobacteria bacterium]NNM14931.1 peptidoglycan DD-metalloendopeptidase family protein [Gammaproteobacteria bacterium]